MSLTEHTPGPWKANEYDEIVAGPNDEIVVCIADDESVPGEQVTANARLLAAAPRLLDACLDIEAWLEAYVDGCGAEYEEARAALRAAIAQAKGTQEN